MDLEEVQTQELVSQEEPVSPAGEKPAEISQEEKLAELIQQKVATEIAKATEASRREIQSVKDKARAEVESALRRAHAAEYTMGATRTQLQSLDPDVAKEMELTEFRVKEQNRAIAEQEEQSRRVQTEHHQQFFTGLANYITGLGIDIQDQRIDWAQNASNYYEAQNRVLDSVAKIQKGNTQTTQGGLEKRLKDLEAKLAQAGIEANSVDTTTSPGVVTSSDTEFVKKFGSGDLPMTKENVDRYNKIQNT